MHHIFKFRKNIFVATIVIIISSIIILGPLGLLEYTASPVFCGSCHVMDSRFEDWFLSGLHRNIKCIDCHLPNNNIINHFIWKSIDGAKELVLFYLCMYGDPIKATSHAKGTIQTNCVRCHDEMVSRITVDDKNCWDCHRKINHNVTNFSLQK